MNDKTKDRWLYPLLTGAIAGLATGIPLMIWGAWYSGVKWHSPFSSYWFKLVFTAPVPLWFAFPLAVLAVFSSWKTYRMWGRNSYLEASAKEEGHWQTVAGVLKMQRDGLEEKMAEVERKEPKLHGVWIPTQAYWAHGAHGTEPATQVVGWIDVSTSNTNENIFLLAGYINGRRAQIFGDLAVKPGVVNKSQVFLFFWPPLETKDGEPLEAIIVVEDQFNRKYELPHQEFHSTPSQQTLPALRVEPKLHLAWRFVGWCWTDVDEVMITGDGTLVLDNVKDYVMFTGVKVEGAEVTDVFDGFTLKPSEPYFRGISVKFKGMNPKDDVPLKAKLTFVDLRGNEYPVAEHEFRLLEHPERFGGIPF